jgi:DNA-binding FadR family transcriptional regulator
MADARRPTQSPSRRSSPLRTIRRTQLSEEVRRQLEEAIRRGDFASGERLPSERELVATFGVSRVSVREAIRSLEGLGLVRVYQGRGAFVTDRRSGFGEPIARWLDIHRDEILELLDVRAALDGFAVECAVRRDDADGIAAIVTAAVAFAQAVEEGAETAELVGLDIDFHLAIADAAGNRLLYDLLSDVHLYLAESRHVVLAPPGRPAQSAAEHARILDAVVARDAGQARAATQAHFASVRELLAAQLGLDAVDGTIAV